jgi:hypothetical protein
MKCPMKAEYRHDSQLFDIMASRIAMSGHENGSSTSHSLPAICHCQFRRPEDVHSLKLRAKLLSSLGILNKVRFCSHHRIEFLEVLFKLLGLGASRI